MNGLAIGGINAACPNCSATKIIGPSELGQGIECWECGTDFHVLRHRRRKLLSHAPRTEYLMRQWGQPPRPTRPENRGAMALIILLLLLAVLGTILAGNWTEIAEGSSVFGELLPPEVVEIHTVAPDPQNLPK